MSDDAKRGKLTFQDVLDFYLAVEASSLCKNMKVSDFTLTLDRFSIHIELRGWERMITFAGSRGPVRVEREGNGWSIRRGAGPGEPMPMGGDFVIGSSGWPVLGEAD